MSTPTDMPPDAPAETSRDDPSPAPLPVAQALAAFFAVVNPAIDVLKASLQSIPPNESASHARVSPAELRAIPLITTMLRENPMLAGATADEVDDAMADADSCSQGERTLMGVVTLLRSTRRLRVESGWQISYDALSAGRRRAAHSAPIASDVAAIDAILAQGPRAEQAAHAAVTAQAKAARAVARVEKAQEKANAAVARAAALNGTGEPTANTPPMSRDEPAPTTNAAEGEPAATEHAAAETT